MAKQKVVIYWSRRDFRLCDNPALFNAIQNCKKKDESNTTKYFLPIFILEDYMLEANTSFQFGYPSRYFLSRAIPKFAEKFESFLLVKGKVLNTFVNLQKLLSKYDIEMEIHVNEDVYIDFYKQIEKLKKTGLNIKVYKDQLTIDQALLTGAGNRYSIFTPFKKAVWKDFLLTSPLEKVKTSDLNYLENNILKNVQHQIEINEGKIWEKFSHKRELEIVDYKERIKHKIDIDKVLSFKPELGDWYVSEEEALKRMHHFVKNLISRYGENRDSLENDALEPGNLSGKTSKLSLALAWGLVSARTIKQEIQNQFDDDFVDINWFDKSVNEKSGAVSYLSELIWREFYKYLLFHNSGLMNTEFQERFRNKIVWAEGGDALKRFQAWIAGKTGYKIVDAAMMQLAKTGWMHNRSRMIVASVLTKNLGVDWRWGQEYFRSMLIDLDEASNNGGWQWGASVGADPKPIRIFNPYLQAENYDKNNLYQKKWLGEDDFFFGPSPIVEHKAAREEALRRYGLEKIKKESVRDY